MPHPNEIALKVGEYVTHDLSLSLAADRKDGNANTVHRISAQIGEYRMVAIVCLSTDPGDAGRLEEWTVDLMLSAKRILNKPLNIWLPDVHDLEGPSKDPGGA